VVAGLDETLHGIALECGLAPSFLVVEGPREEFWRLRVLDEPPSQVARLKVLLRFQGVDDPHLVPRAAGRYVVPLLEHLLVAKVECSACRGVHNRHENHVSFISLKLEDRFAEHRSGRGRKW
jgi:hypothetical protein